MGTCITLQWSRAPILVPAHPPAHPASSSTPRISLTWFHASVVVAAHDLPHPCRWLAQVVGSSSQHDQHGDTGLHWGRGQRVDGVSLTSMGTPACIVGREEVSTTPLPQHASSAKAPPSSYLLEHLVIHYPPPTQPRPRPPFPPACFSIWSILPLTFAAALPVRALFTPAWLLRPCRVGREGEALVGSQSRCEYRYTATYILVKSWQRPPASGLPALPFAHLNMTSL